MEKLYLSVFVLCLVTRSLALDIPDSINIAIQPEDVLEMEVIKRTLSIYIADSKGKLITVLGGGTWNCKVSLVSGPGGELLGTTSTAFVNGTASFPGLIITEAGPDYVLLFEVTYPTTANIPPVQTPSFNVGARPLGIKLQENPLMRAGNRDFAVRATIWDEAIDEEASEAVLEDLSWECDLMNSGGLSGNTQSKVAPGNGTIVFEAVKLNTLGPNQVFSVECFSPGYFVKPIISVQSDPFIVHDFPDTSLLRKTIAEVSFTGPYSLVEDAILAYNSLGLYGKATCEGCPPGVLPKPKELMDKKLIREGMTGWEPCTAPIFLNKNLECQLPSPE